MKTEEIIYEYMDSLTRKEEEVSVEVVEEEVSPTMSFINNYLTYINEQGEVPLDTEPVDATDVTEQPTEVEPLTTEGERYLVGLLVKAFLHVPDESEGKIVKELQATLLDKNPKNVAESIESMLELSVNDTKQTLGLTTDMN